MKKLLITIGIILGITGIVYAAQPSFNTGQIVTTGSTTSGGIPFINGTQLNASSNLVFASSTGYLGIRKSDPQVPLDINVPIAGGDAVRLHETGNPDYGTLFMGGAEYHIDLYSDDGATACPSGYDNRGLCSGIQMNINGENEYFVNGNVPYAGHHFYINNVGKFRITNSGKTMVGTSTTETSFEPPQQFNVYGNAYLASSTGLGTTSPWRTLSVNGSSDLGINALAGYFTATTSTASVFPYASTTAISATTLCLTGDACKTTWPISSPATSTNPLMYSYGIATSTTATSTFAKSVIVGTTTVTTVNNESLKVVGSGSTYTDSANCILHITADKNGNTGAVLGAKNGLCIGIDNQTLFYEGNPYLQAYGFNGTPVPISFNPQGGGIYLNTELGDSGAATTIGGASGKNAYVDLQNIVTDGSKPYTAYVFQPSATQATFEKGAVVYDTSTDYWNCCYARALGGFGIALDYQANNTNALDNLPNDLRFNIKPNFAFSDFGVGIGTTTPTAKLSVMGGCASCSGGSGGVLDLIQVATSTGSPVWGIDNDGHRYTSGPKPTISSCGTGTGTVNGDDSGGTITTATAATACTMTFAKAYQGTSLYCNVTDDSLVGFADVSATSTTAVTFGISSALTGGHLYYQCSYHK